MKQIKGQFSSILECTRSNPMYDQLYTFSKQSHVCTAVKRILVLTVIGARRLGLN